MEGRPPKKVDVTFLMRSLLLFVIVVLSLLLVTYTFFSLKRDVVEGPTLSLLVDIISMSEISPLTPCDVNTLRYLGDELDRIGRLLSVGDYPEYLAKYYFLIEYKHYTMAESMKEECNTDVHTVLFFIRPDCRECDVMANVLTSLKEEMGDRVFIYTFNTSISSPILEYLLMKHGISVFPSVVVDGEFVCSVCPKERLLEVMGEGI